MALPLPLGQGQSCVGEGNGTHTQLALGALTKLSLDLHVFWGVPACCLGSCSSPKDPSPSPMQSRFSWATLSELLALSEQQVPQLCKRRFALCEGCYGSPQMAENQRYDLLRTHTPPPHLTSYRGCQTFADAFDASPAPQALGSRGGKRAGPGISLGGREPSVGGLAKGSSAR